MDLVAETARFGLPLHLTVVISPLVDCVWVGARINPLLQVSGLVKLKPMAKLTFWHRRIRDDENVL